MRSTLQQPLEYSGDVFRYKTQAEIVRDNMKRYALSTRLEQVTYFNDIEEIFESL